MKIYTKTGDKGTTSLIGGKRVAKYHPRIEAYGTVDELISNIGLLRDQSIDKDTRLFLIQIQDRLMNCASILAADCSDCKVRIPKIIPEDINAIELEIDKMDNLLDPLASFILPGGHPIVSMCHICRTICRRCERVIIKLSEETPVPENLIIYINRLSDFFFVLSRKMAKYLNIDQIPWKPSV
ncbi:MAG: cob(I)yrinic acid a,c-diamide adenosyltransferase [Bacteroidales bacterium]|nr:MAG: cob(I)yrinic acid a,c-diamide adenosyltransferase [Bacteroidales bacterium]